jgi:hypothetical protein
VAAQAAAGADRHEDSARGSRPTGEGGTPGTREGQALRAAAGALAAGQGQAAAGAQASAGAAQPLTGARTAVGSGAAPGAASARQVSGTGIPTLQAKAGGLASSGVAGKVAGQAHLARGPSGPGGALAQPPRVDHTAVVGKGEVHTPAVPVWSTFSGGPRFDSLVSTDETDAGVSYSAGAFTDAAGFQDIMVTVIQPGGAGVIVPLFNGDTLFGTAIQVDDNAVQQGNVYVASYDYTLGGSWVEDFDLNFNLQGWSFLPGVYIHALDLGETPQTAGVYAAGWVLQADGVSDTYLAKFNTLANTVLQSASVSWTGAAGIHIGSYGAGVEVDSAGNLYYASTVYDPAVGPTAAYLRINAPFTAINWVYTPSPGNSWIDGSGIEVLRDNGGQDGSVYVIANVIDPASGGPYQSDSLIAKVNAFTGAQVWNVTYGYWGNGDYLQYGLETDDAGNAYTVGFAFVNGLGEFGHLGKFNAAGALGPWVTYGSPTYTGFTAGYAVELNNRTQDGELGHDVDVAGYTTSGTFAPIVNAFQPVYGGGGDGFVSRYR